MTERRARVGQEPLGKGLAQPAAAPGAPQTPEPGPLKMRAGFFGVEGLDERTMNALRHAYPVIVNMRYVTSEGLIQRYLQLGKLKSGQFQATQHLFTIDPRTGIVVRAPRG